MPIAASASVTINGTRERVLPVANVAFMLGSLA